MRTITWIVAATTLFAGLAVAEVIHEEVHCPASSSEFLAMQASFDLTPLRLSSLNYNVKDNLDARERNYTYVFNICADVSHVPDEGCDGQAPAYQIKKGQGFCKRLGNTASDSEWKLIDSLNPTVGISLTYLGGELCDYNGTQRARQLRINFLCSEEQGVSQFEHERVLEDHCEYSLNVKTVFGCPLECNIGANRQLCSGHGFCGMDGDKTRPRCFCYDGFYGTACENQAEKGGYTALDIVLILAVILLTALLAAAVWVYFKVRKLRRRKLYQLDAMDDDSTTVFAIDDSGDL